VHRRRTQQAAGIFRLRRQRHRERGKTAAAGRQQRIGAAAALAQSGISAQIGTEAHAAAAHHQKRRKGLVHRVLFRL